MSQRLTPSGMRATGNRTVEGRVGQVRAHRRLDHVRDGVEATGYAEHCHDIDARGVTFSHDG